MNPFQSLQNLQQLQFYPQLQQLQQLQYIQLLLALNQAAPQTQGLTPFQQLSMFSQSSQRTIAIGAPQIQEQSQKKYQSERILPKYVKREENEIFKQHSQDQIMGELKMLLDFLCKSENINLTPELMEQLKILPQIEEQLVSIINERFTNQKKTKEEQIKFIMRKCFKFLKTKMNLNELTMSAYEIEKVFYKEYFGNNGSVEEMIPFRSDSANKTMNTSYLKRIFASPKFYEGYLEFLEMFSDIWDQENQEKINNMSKQVVKFLQSGQTERIKTYKRVPWVLSMKSRCYELAVSFKQYSPLEKMGEQIKIQECSPRRDEQIKEQENEDEDHIRKQVKEQQSLD